MERAVLAVGCDIYECIEPNLNGAELDARRVFEQLVNPNIGGYAPSRSRLLLSPSLGELRAAVQEIVYEGAQLDTFTLYFAGHGALDGGGFYMELRDTRSDRLPITAYWLSEALAVLSSKPPTVTNIILDACYSGGLVNDVHVLIKPETHGDAGTPAVILLAMASRDQVALETGEGGFGTNALLECLDGRIFIQEHAAALDLMEIGSAVASRVGANPKQQPRFWALNVHEKSVFCRNPHFQASLDATFRHWTPRSVIDAVGPFLASHAGSPADIIADIERLVGGLIIRARDSRDMFLEAQVRASAVVALLPFCRTSVAISSYVEQQSLAVSELVVCALKRVTEEVNINKYALLSPCGGLGDLYVLPVRIWRIIGWSGAAYFILKSVGRTDEFPNETFAKFLDAILEHYSPSAVLLSELQGSSIAIGLACAAEIGLQDQGEVLLGVLFNSILRVGGNVARGSLTGADLFYYMAARYYDNIESVADLVANPSEAVTVVLRLCPLFDLEDVFDEMMSEIDHVNFNIFVADDYYEFGGETIVNGDNHTFTIGRGVWTIADLMAVWPAEAARGPDTSSVVAGVLLASLLFPNRVPWFVVPLRANEAKIT